MTILIGAGIGARKRAMAGFGAAADMEAKEIRNIEALEAAGKAQDMQTMGTGAGFGAMYGINKVMAAKAAAEGKGAAQLDGRMIDAASERMAENIVNIDNLIQSKK